MTAAFTARRERSLAIITFDLPGDPVNKISKAVGWELEGILQELAVDEAVRGVVIRSGKPDSFIAGADIVEFTQLRTVEEAVRLSRDGQLLMQKIAEFSKPVVAAIHGTCLGGGLELALACRYRVASDHSRTMLGLPETQLGLIPGAGGSNRLPRLIGARAALGLILPGKQVPARKALQLGMVDEVVPESILLETAMAAAERSLKSRSHNRGLMAWLMDRNPLGRRVVFARAARELAASVGENYPAPLRAIEVIREGLATSLSGGLELEAQAFGELAMTDVSRRLVEIFYSTNALKKDDGVSAGVGRALPVRRVGVVGAGFMGAGIAGTTALVAGAEVRLKDSDLSRVGRGIFAATRVLRNSLDRHRLTPHEFERKRALLTGTDAYDGFGSMQLVIEAVFEDLTVKRQVIGELEKVLPPDAVIATNTSTIPIHDIALNARDPGRILGMHFFSPVERMPLLEVIPGPHTTADTIVTAVQFGRRMGKTVIVVADSPGFWINRTLLPYLNEAGLLLEEGVPVELIDQIMTSWGFPVGPVTLIDEVGLDVAEKAGKVMHQAFGDRLLPSRVIGVMRADNRLGRKNGRGFYFYREGRKAGPDGTVYQLLGARAATNVDPQRIEDRLVFAMLNEAAMAMSEGVVRQPRDADLGAIYGIGYPAFRGGPLRTIDTLGPSEVVARLERLETSHGVRFHPAPVLLEMARTGSRWYPLSNNY